LSLRFLDDSPRPARRRFRLDPLVPQLLRKALAPVLQVRLGSLQPGQIEPLRFHCQVHVRMVGVIMQRQKVLMVVAEGILGKASVTPPPARIADNLIHLNKAFASDRLEDIFEMLEADDAEAPALTVSAIHDDAGYRRVRSTLARQYDIGEADPNIQVNGANLKGNRKLFLEHRMHRGVPLHAQLRAQVMPHIERLWGYEVALDALASLPPDVRLLVAGGARVEGERPYLERLRETIAARALDKELPPQS